MTSSKRKHRGLLKIIEHLAYIWKSNGQMTAQTLEKLKKSATKLIANDRKLQEHNRKYRDKIYRIDVAIQLLNREDLQILNLLEDLLGEHRTTAHISSIAIHRRSRELIGRLRKRPSSPHHVGSSFPESSQSEIPPQRNDDHPEPSLPENPPQRNDNRPEPKIRINPFLSRKP